MSTYGAIGDAFNCIRVEIDRRAKDGGRVLDVMLEVRRKQVGALFGKDAEELLERLKWGSFVKVGQILTILQQRGEVELQVSKERSEIVRVIPAPTGQVLEIVLVDEFQAVYVVCKDVDKFVGMLLRV